MKAKELIEILQKVEPDSGIYFMDFSKESKRYKIVFVEKIEGVYTESGIRSCYLKIMFG